MLKAAVPVTPAVDPIRITDAPSRSRGSAFCTVKITPFTLRPNVSSYCASLMAPSGSIEPPPAFVNRTSICECFCWTAS